MTPQEIEAKLLDHETRITDLEAKFAPPPPAPADGPALPVNTVYFPITPELAAENPNATNSTPFGGGGATSWDIPVTITARGMKQWGFSRIAAGSPELPCTVEFRTIDGTVIAQAGNPYSLLHLGGTFDPPPGDYVAHVDTQGFPAAASFYINNTTLPG